MEELTLIPQSSDEGVTDTVEVLGESERDPNAAVERPLYGLFVIPVILIFTGVLCGYLKKCHF